MSDPSQLAEIVEDGLSVVDDQGARAEGLLALNELLADPFLRYRDKIVESLRFMSNLSASGDYSGVIADMATELLGDLGEE